MHSHIFHDGPRTSQNKILLGSMGFLPSKHALDYSICQIGKCVPYIQNTNYMACKWFYFVFPSNIIWGNVAFKLLLSFLSTLIWIGTLLRKPHSSRQPFTLHCYNVCARCATQFTARNMLDHLQFQDPCCIKLQPGKRKVAWLSN